MARMKKIKSQTIHIQRGSRVRRGFMVGTAMGEPWRSHPAARLMVTVRWDDDNEGFNGNCNANPNRDHVAVSELTCL